MSLKCECLTYISQVYIIPGFTLVFVKLREISKISLSDIEAIEIGFDEIC